MKTLQISDETYAQLRKFATDANQSDEDVLKRLVSGSREELEAALRAYELAEQDTSATN